MKFKDKMKEEKELQADCKSEPFVIELITEIKNNLNVAETIVFNILKSCHNFNNDALVLSDCDDECAFEKNTHSIMEDLRLTKVKTINNINSLQEIEGILRKFIG